MGGAWGDPALKPVSPSRTVMGRYGNRELGLPLITDVLKRNGLAATFFVEAFMAEQGYDGWGERICAYLLARGQDVQLHIHPNHNHFGLKEQVAVGEVSNMYVITETLLGATKVVNL